MAPAPPVYDLMLLLDAEAPSERRAEILREVEAFIERAGTISSRHEWGVRGLSYEIDHRGDAEYHLLQFTAPAETIERLRGTLRITDGVLRHRIIKVLPGTPPPPTVRAEPRVAAPVAAAVGAGESAGAAVAAPTEAAPAEAEAAPAPADPAETPASAEAATAPAEATPPAADAAPAGDDAPAETPPAA